MKKKVGIIVNSLFVSKQIKDLIELSTKSNNYEITTLILNNHNKNEFGLFSKIISYIKRHGIKKFINVRLFIFICKLENLFLKRHKKFSKFNLLTKISKEKFQIINVNPLISKNGLVYRYSKSDIDKIAKHNLNLIIRASSGILKGEILNTCPNGVISFHHGDNNINRGGPPGFWEVYNSSPQTGFIIQRLTENLDGGDVLYKGFIKTRWYYSLNLASLYEITNPFLHKVIEDLTSKTPKLSIYAKLPYSFPLFTTPNVYQSISYLCLTIFRLLKKKFYTLRGMKHNWGIAYQFVDEWESVSLRNSTKIFNPKNRYFADPFIIERYGENYCFVEDFNYDENKGSISAFKISSNGYKELGEVLNEDFHLSFPFLFEYENQIFMCPETSAINEIRLYKCIDFPFKWVFFKTIMKNVSAADTIIFHYKQKWWLLTNIDESHIQDHSCQLHVFYSSNPLNEDWKAHESNPVIFDSNRARNGGLIVQGKEIYRVFQKQGFDLYGEGLGIAKIDNLNTKMYNETIVSNVKARFFDKIIGTHSLNFKNGLMVIDYLEIN